MFGKRKPLRWLTGRPIAHRGLHDIGRGRPENSLVAFEDAARAGYAIECDLHPAADGVPMVFHDDDLQRLTGTAGCVRDFGSHDLSRRTLLGTPERVPTLDQLIDLVSGAVPLVIELKHIPGRDAGFALAVMERLQHYDGPAAVMSFDPALLVAAKAAAPHFPLGLTAEGDWHSARRHFDVMRRTGADFISYRVQDLPTAMPVLARRLMGVPLICWTVRTPGDQETAAAWADQITFEGFLPHTA